MEYAMAIKNSTNSIVFKTQADSLAEAEEYFIKLKQLTKKQFNELFIVSEVKTNG